MDGARQQPQLKIRLPIEVKAVIEDRAQRNFRSINNEILARLVESISRETGNENAPAAVTAEAPI